MKQLLLASLCLLLPMAMLAQTAKIQLIHNSADIALATIDLYLDGVLWLDDLPYHSASSFVTVPAGAPIQLHIAFGNSTSVTDAVASFTYNLTDNRHYILVADGIISANLYMPGNAGAKAFDLKKYDDAFTTALSPAATDLLFHHGVTDAGEIDWLNFGTGASLASNVAFGLFEGYEVLATNDYRIKVAYAGSSLAIGVYDLPLSSLGLNGEAVTVVASGFLDPQRNNEGEPFGLWLARPSGGALIELEKSTAKVQLLHNAADLELSQVDVYLDGELLLDNVVFRTATAYLELPAGSTIQLALAPDTSTSVNSALAAFLFNLEVDALYSIMISGIYNGSGYDPASIGIHALNMRSLRHNAQVAPNMNQVKVHFHHGTTDAPTIDIRTVAGGGTILVDDLSYGVQTPSQVLQQQAYVIEVTDAAGINGIKSYVLPLTPSAIGSEPVSIIASGFLDPSQNSNGAAFGLFTTPENGGAFVPLQEKVNSIQRLDALQGIALSIAPNPVVQESLSLLGMAERELNTAVTVVDLQGQTVLSFPAIHWSKGQQRLRLPVHTLPNGAYFLRLMSDTQQMTVPFSVLR